MLKPSITKQLYVITMSQGAARIIYNHHGPEHSDKRKGNIKRQINVIEQYYIYSVVLQKISTNYRSCLLAHSILPARQTNVISISIA